MTLTRREAMLLGASAPLVLGTRAALAQAEGDAAILEAAAGLELLSVYVYEAAIAAAILDPELTKTAELFRDQEQQHADALGTELEALGGTRPGKPADAKAADEQLRSHGIDAGLALDSQASFLALAIELETTATALYYDAHQKLQDANLLQTSTSIMANEAQHLVVLRQALGREPVPSAFVTGK